MEQLIDNVLTEENTELSYFQNEVSKLKLKQADIAVSSLSDRFKQTKNTSELRITKQMLEKTKISL
jgi:hypothetical protein